MKATWERTGKRRRLTPCSCTQSWEAMVPMYIQVDLENLIPSEKSTNRRRYYVTSYVK